MSTATFAPTLLVAMPQMQDPNFSRSVVLLWKQNDEGALGLVINQATDTPVTALVNLDPTPETDNGMPVWKGGPVEPEKGWLLLAFDPGSQDALKIDDKLYLSSSANVLCALIESEPEAADRGRFLMGYAGWTAGQLEAELAQSAWLMVEPSPELIFETEAELIWERAIRNLGVDPMALQEGGGVH